MSEQAEVREQGMEADVFPQRKILSHLQNATRYQERAAGSEQAEIMAASDRDGGRI